MLPMKYDQKINRQAKLEAGLEKIFMCGDIKRFEITQNPKTEQEKYFISIRWWFINVLFILPLYGSSQLHQDERLEIPISFENESFEVIPTKAYGLILYREVSTELGDQLEIIHTDTSFQEKWRGFLPIDKSFVLGKHTAVQERLYLIFYDRDFSDRNFQLYEINLNTGNYSKFIVRNLLPFLPTTFEVTSMGALIGGYFNRVPLVLFFEFNTQKSKILPGLFNETGELTQLKINYDGTFDVLISARNYQKQQTIWVKNYDAGGGLLRNTMLQPEGANNLLFARTIQSKDYNQVVAGVFGNRNSNFSKGLFVATVNFDGVQRINYYNFADLENFFKYMRAKKEQRIKERIQRKKIKGRKIRFQYRFIVHELVPYKNQFILLGEAFYPRYKQIDRNFTSGLPLESDTRVFDGYQYTHAAVLGIGSSGNLLWDNSFEINDVKTFTLEQFVKMDARGDEIALLYLYDNKIRTKIIQDSTVLEGKTYNQLQMKFDSNFSSTDQSSINKLEYWYDDYFLAYGVQNVVSTTPKMQKRRKVFFVTKISYQ